MHGCVGLRATVHSPVEQERASGKTGTYLRLALPGPRVHWPELSTTSRAVLSGQRHPRGPFSNAGHSGHMLSSKGQGTPDGHGGVAWVPCPQMTVARAHALVDRRCDRQSNSRDRMRADCGPRAPWPLSATRDPADTQGLTHFIFPRQTSPNVAPAAPTLLMVVA